MLGTHRLRDWALILGESRYHPPMSRTTPQRQAIRDALASAGRPLSPNELLDLAQDEIPKLGMATVYRTLSLLVEEGEAVAVELPGEPPRYEHRSAAEHHHHHFRCDSCERVFDVEGCPGNMKGMLPKGFSLRAHHITLFGTCDDCARKAG